jgi:hypothetical protein
MPVNEFYEAIGVIHVHSSYSDGSKKIEEIAKIGEHAGLDFLMFTDHGTLKPLHDGHQKFYGKTAVIIGYEIEDENDENHYLAFGLEKTPGSRGICRQGAPDGWAGNNCPPRRDPRRAAAISLFSLESLGRGGL